jgi:hypothetical protein
MGSAEKRNRTPVEFLVERENFNFIEKILSKRSTDVDREEVKASLWHRAAAPTVETSGP